MGAFTIGDKVREELTTVFIQNDFISGSSSQVKVDAYKEYDAER